MRLLSHFKKDGLTERLEKIKMGDQEERDRVINEYIPFIIKNVSNQTNRYIETENSEEYSIGIEAFNEAIDKYEFSRGSFIGFAEIVIKNKIIDYNRKSIKHKNTFVMSELEDKEAYAIQKRLSTEDFTETFELKSEMRDLEKELEKFDITLNDLVNESPKHINTRMNALRIARYIASNESLKQGLMKKKVLPSKKLIQKLGVTKKILKRSKKFIISIVIILDSDLEQLKEYISEIEGGVTNDV